MRNLLKIIGLSLLIFGCKKNDIQWELERNGINDFLNPSYYCYKTLDCNDTVGFKSKEYGYNGATRPWRISDYGHIGQCLKGDYFGGEIEFISYFEDNSIFTFWVLVAGDAKRAPGVYIDEILQNYTVLNVDENWDFHNSKLEWVQVKINGLIPYGGHKVKIEFTKSNVSQEFSIDDIGFYKLKEK